MSSIAVLCIRPLYWLPGRFQFPDLWRYSCQHRNKSRAAAFRTGKEFPLPIKFCCGIKSQDNAPATELQYQTTSPKSQWAGFLVGNGSSLACRKHWGSKAPNPGELWSETHSSAENGWKQLSTHYLCLNESLICKICLLFMSESKYWTFLGPHKLFVVTASSIKVHMQTMDFF